MTARDTDFLARCVAGTVGNPLLEQIRDRSAEVLLAVYRLLKISLVHTSENDAVRDAAAQSADILRTFSAEVGSAATLTFVDDSAFICGQLLRASRSVYESAEELGELLAKVGVSECAFDGAVTAADVVALARAFAHAMRDAAAREQFATSKLSNIVVRKVDPQLTRRVREDDLPPAERVLRLYANALVVMRTFYEDIAAGKTILPHRVKRLAQRLVVVAETEDPAVLGMTAMAKAHRDDAGRALQSAILALAVARTITRDRVTLAQLAMAALMSDVGRARHVDDKRVPASASYACVVTGGINPTSANRAVIVSETSWIERADVIGPLWNGDIPPMLASQILALVRELLERIAPRDAGNAMSAHDALEVMASARSDRTLVRLLVSAIGLAPTGSVVELEKGEWAVVMGSSRHGPHACVVRLVTDARGAALENLRTIDLGDEGAPRIARIVDPQRARFNVTRAFVST